MTLILGGGENCGAWGKYETSTMILCVGTGDEEIGLGTMEELMMHESVHLTIDPLFLADEVKQYRWACAICQDQNFISEYAQSNFKVEDIAESIVPWYAVHTRYVLSHLT